MLGMEQRSRSKDAAVKDAQIMLREEECAKGTEQSLNYVALKDAPIKLRMEECVLSMEQSAAYAAV